MRVSERAWHLRVARIGNKRYQPRDLCSYFWHVVYQFVLGAGILLCGAISIAQLVHVPLHFLLYVAIGVGMAVGVIVAAVIFIALGFALWNLTFGRRTGRRPAPKEKGFLMSYFSARKRKFCPLIEVTK